MTRDRYPTPRWWPGLISRLKEANTPQRLIVFDCDGTLVDSQGAIVTTMTAAFAGLGLPPPVPDAFAP